MLHKTVPQIDPLHTFLIMLDSPLQLLNLYALLFDNPMSNLAGDKRFVLVIGQRGKAGCAVMGV
jgi:hypothetical protein